MDSLGEVVVVLGLLGVAAEILGLITTTNRIRKLCYSLVFGTVAFCISVLMLYPVSITLILIIYVGIFRAFNALRAVAERMSRHRLLKVTRQSSLVLLYLQIVSVFLWYVIKIYQVSDLQILTALLAISCLVGLVLLASTVRTLRKSSFNPNDNRTADLELPTISVCIPARNETDYLAACLQSVIDSDYPKLEILVLDDCSHDKTSEIIRGFAQKGVRFIKGDEPRQGWLAKNQAYDVLASTANGDILVFMGVDVRLSKSALKSVVATMHARNKQMISVLPKGEQDYSFGGVIQPMRYWWEVALPRRWFNRPPVLSTLWAIESNVIKKLGGFKAVNKMVVPEAYFARETALRDGYSFMRSISKLGVSSYKQLDEQWDTAVRVRYPQLRHRPENVLLVSLVEILMFILPLFIFLSGFIFSFGLIWILAGVVSIIYGTVHYHVVSAYRPRASSLYLLLMPVSVVFDLIILYMSMYRYEFSKVVWKERNICIPVMRRIPKLPGA